MSLPALCRFQLLVCKVKAGGGGLQWGLTRKSVLPELTQRYKKKKVTYKKKVSISKKIQPLPPRESGSDSCNKLTCIVPH